MCISVSISLLLCVSVCLDSDVYMFLYSSIKCPKFANIGNSPKKLFNWLKPAKSVCGMILPLCIWLSAYIVRGEDAYSGLAPKGSY